MGLGKMSDQIVNLVAAHRSPSLLLLLSQDIRILQRESDKILNNLRQFFLLDGIAKSSWYGCQG